MKQILQNYKTGELKLDDVPVPCLKAGGVLVKNEFSLVSVGTEKSMTELAQKSIIGKAKERPDLVKQVIEKAKKDGIANTISAVRNKLDVVKPLGYSSAGLVVEAGEGADEFLPHDRVACAGAGYASHADVIFVPKNLCAKIPESVSSRVASCATLGAVALQGARIANPLLGEKVAVIGLGLVGQITAQFLQSSGCMVLGFDLDPGRVEMALKMGMDMGVSNTGDMEAAVKSISKDYGMDAVIITASTPSSAPVEMAGKISRDKGRVVVVGNVGMNVPRDSFYKKELDLRLSRSYGPGRYDTVYEEKGIDYPLGYVRWTEKRNMETFLEFVEKGRLNIEPLITHCFPFEDAETVYGLLNGKVSIDDAAVTKYKNDLLNEKQAPTSGNNLLGVIFEYKDWRSSERRLSIDDINVSGSSRQTVNVGLIGSGNFVRTTLVPALKANENICLKGLATATGMNAKINAKKHEFEYCTTDYNEILNDANINLVIIATRHNLHSKLVIETLQKGKDVFVEKPLALSMDELEKVVDVWKTSGKQLLVGFNRRFSPFTIAVNDFFANRKGPLTLNYRINAGFIPADNWVHDQDEGGGRIIGEVCHFVDLMRFLVKADPVKVYADVVSGNSNFVNDNLNINLKFKDGSIGAITYVSSGDKSFPKERLEIFGDGAVAVIDDFRSATLIKNGKTRKIRGVPNDKGHKGEINQFVGALRNGNDSPIPFSDSVAVTQTTFNIIESIKKGMPICFE